MWMDPELAALSVLIPRFDFSDVARARELEMRLATQSQAKTPGVQSADYEISGRNGTKIALRAYRPSNQLGYLPLLLWLHGGGFMLGGLHTEEERAEHYASHTSCVVVSVDYRLAPEHPFPAAFHDVEDALFWSVENAATLGVDQNRIVVGGNSAGGALAAALALSLRRSTALAVTHQLLVCPVLDDTMSTASAKSFTSTPVWDVAANTTMWQTYLADAREPIDFRAAPTRADDLRGVAPASMWIAEQDPVRDEALEYAARLMKSGVQVSLHQYRGTFHGFDNYRMTGVGKRALRDQVWDLRRVFHGAG